MGIDFYRTCSPCDGRGFRLTGARSFSKREECDNCHGEALLIDILRFLPALEEGGAVLKAAQAKPLREGEASPGFLYYVNDEEVGRKTFEAVALAIQVRAGARAQKEEADGEDEGPDR